MEPESSDWKTIRPSAAFEKERPAPVREPLDAEWLKAMARDCGADDVGLVEVGCTALDDQRDDSSRSSPRPGRYWVSCTG